MSSQVISTSPSLTAFVGEVFERARPRRAWGALALGLAFSGHVVAALMAPHAPPRAAPSPPPLEVELAPPEVPPAPPVPEPEPPKAPAEAPRAEPAQLRAPAVAPEPARAAALITAKADPTPPPSADEPVDFTNDPSVLGFGSGLVAVGGKAAVGLPGAKPAPAQAALPARFTGPVGDALTPVSNLSRKPSLGENDPCHGFFPNGAASDDATAAVLLTIGKSGAVSSVKLLSESPPQQGFGGAARACMASKRFTPGLDRDGNPTATSIRVNIHFRR